MTLLLTGQGIVHLGFIFIFILFWSVFFGEEKRRLDVTTALPFSRDKSTLIPSNLSLKNGTAVLKKGLKFK